MKLFFHDYPGWQPHKEEFLKAPKCVQKFASIVVDKVKVLSDQVKSLTSKIKVKDGLLKAKDALLKKKDAVIARLFGENKELKAQIADLKKQNKQKDTIIQRITNRSQANSTNSNLPPSKDPIGFDRSKAKNDGKGKNQSEQKTKGSTKDQKDKKDDGQKKKARHPGASRPILAPTREEDCLPEVCPHCGCSHLVDLTESSMRKPCRSGSKPIISHSFPYIFWHMPQLR